MPNGSSDCRRAPNAYIGAYGIIWPLALSEEQAMALRDCANYYGLPANVGYMEIPQTKAAKLSGWIKRILKKR